MTTPDPAPDPALGAWRQWVDLDRLAAWMDDRGLEAGPIEAAERPPGGTQNLLLRFRRGERWFFDYGDVADADDEPIYRLGQHRFAVGEYVAITDEDRRMLTYKVTEVTEVTPV